MAAGTDGTAPRRVIVAGDWHGNGQHAVGVIRAAALLLSDEREPLIVHCGDFGIWPGAFGAAYQAVVRDACEQYGVRIWFVDGNHEDFTQIGKFRGGDPVRWLPRGMRWTWHGRTWLALGGGVSLDKAVRAQGRDWWPEEEITWPQALEAIQGGPAHVLVSHDCPEGVTHSFPPPPSFWDLRDLKRNELHRKRLQVVTDAVRPGWLLHGHLHRSYQRMTEFSYGPCEVTGLDCDGGSGPNWAVLDVERMAWEETEADYYRRAADDLAALTEELGLYGEN